MKRHLQKWLVTYVFMVALPFQAQSCLVCTKTGINMPVSLAPGTVRTPEFPIKRGYYNIKIEVGWLMPTDELRCRMGFAMYPSDNHCKLQSVLETDWKVLDGERVVAQGSDKGRSGAFDADKDHLIRHIGLFRGEPKHKYVVEVTFIKDGSILNVTQPRLIVEPPDSF